MKRFHYFPPLAAVLLAAGALTAQPAPKGPEMELPKLKPTVVPMPVKAARDSLDPNVALTNPKPMWEVSKGEGVILFVADTGIDAKHPEFNGHKITFKNFSTSPDPDVDEHGTHVAGTAVGRGNVDGLAPHVDELVALKVLGDDGRGDFTWLRQAVDFARDYCKRAGKPGVFTASLGGGANPRTDPRTVTPDLQKSVVAGIQEGMIFLFAAGNDNSKLPPNSVGFPARYAEISGPLEDLIVVSACDVNRRVASFSSVGPATRVTVPGVKVLGPLPNGRYGEWDGTSMATPIMAGIACCWMSASHKDVPAKDRQKTFAEEVRKASSFPDQRHPSRGFGLPDCGKLFAAKRPAPSPDKPFIVTITIDDLSSAKRAELKAGGVDTLKLEVGHSVRPAGTQAVVPVRHPVGEATVYSPAAVPVPSYWVPAAQPWHQAVPQSVPQAMPGPCPGGVCVPPAYQPAPVWVPGQVIRRVFR